MKQGWVDSLEVAQLANPITEGPAGVDNMVNGVSVIRQCHQIGLS